ncbi:hypothetical protein Dsin_032067 [Dipteronia sinensis]|uniref:Uncharacterized protein n=1 Tax=Dipteronia sinensis TaxID=43782 RepID=A0AAD9ZMJ1_9ROSI|nr:hypothetical protein Dsin_032067 [Dipteronia sinensis]
MNKPNVWAVETPSLFLLAWISFQNTSIKFYFRDSENHIELKLPCSDNERFWEGAKHHAPKLSALG